ncbi:KH domain-containing protein [Priestia koreensis]|uniref:KH domain-containing protein n=1 Tax=Priestia koreensis TaxID=284581 RepID=UPI001F5892F4|nr:KH domain-containing protein [Priestia koreensis]MCM3003798.1 KH domain-containing protein [Priestia koreensis]UNL83903.1 KH domain-containing protein [Priestia koreensis]
MKSLLETIVKPLIDNPHELHVREVLEDHSVTYLVTVHPDDMGKVIGKQGRIAKAIRTVVYAAGSQLDKKVYVKFDQ